MSISISSYFFSNKARANCCHCLHFRDDAHHDVANLPPPLRNGHEVIPRIQMDICSCFILHKYIFFYSALTAAERGYKLALVVSAYDQFNEEYLFNNTAYLCLYYIRFFFYPVFYALLINFCLRIIDPIFYKPNKWLN